VSSFPYWRCTRNSWSDSQTRGFGCTGVLSDSVSWWVRLWIHILTLEQATDNAQTYISCFVTGPAISCEHTKAFLENGVMCYSAKDTRHQTASMYYAFAVDAVTNLMVMFLPIRLVWPLQMARHRKIGVCVLFALGFVCIIFSTIRIVQITNGKTKSPDPKWLTMWTVIECSTGM
jgi:hypothetical protein